MFDTLTLSTEDKNRTAMYREEIARRNLQVQTTDMKAYLKSLKMEIDISFADEFSIPRIAQLTQKTNQFNLTTKRYSEDDIKILANSDQSDVIYLKLKDRFGDSGIVGVCILRYLDNKSTFDTFLLSCRVLGRRVEDVFLAQILKFAKKRGCEVAIGEYYETTKNSQVRDFYINRGFQEFEGNPDNGRLSFQCELNVKAESGTEYFNKINLEINK